MQVEFGDETLRKVTWRLLPVAMLLFFFSLLDRTNIGFAALQLNTDLGLSPEQFGLAAGAFFFVGYVAFEIPSNLIMARVGARLWLARIMVSWGLIVGAIAFAEGPRSLYVLRFLLGLAEAGLLPGLLLYLGLWLPGRHRGAAYATLLSTTALAYAIGGPFTTLLMNVSIFGLKGWQTMFVIQGALTVVIGAGVLVLLPNRIEDAAWLSPGEKIWLRQRLADEEAQKRLNGATSLREGFLDPRVLLATLTCFFLICANFGTVLWLPQILKASFPDWTNVQISLLISVAFIMGGIAGIIWARHSDRTGDRKWHLVGSALLAALGYAVAALAPNPSLQFMGICAGVIGIWSMFGVFWGYAGDLLGGAAAAGGLAFVNSIGSLGGVFGPWALGLARQQTGSFTSSLLALAAFALATGLLAASLRLIARPGSNDPVPARAN